MKKIAAIILALVLFPVISSVAQAAGGRLYVVSGNVFVAQGKSPAHLVANNEVIVSDTLINTGDKSTALLRFDDGQIVTMQANSSFQVREYRYDAKRIENSNIVFSMFKGGMRFITGLIGQKRKQAFRLLTPNATIGIRGTEFMVAMADKSVYSQVLYGNIGMTNAGGTTVLGAGQTAVAASSRALASMIPASAIPSGTFSDLLSIPVNPSAIPAPAPPAPPPVSVPAASGGVTTGMAGTGAAVTAGGAALGIAGGALVGIVGSDTDSKQAEPAPAPVAIPAEPTEPAKTAEEQKTSADSRSGMGVTAKIGTLGYGAELNFGSSDSFSARLGLNAFTYKYNANSGAANYDFKMQLQTISALADWYPFSGGFRTSAGLFYNNNKLTLNAVPGAGGYTIGGIAYPTGISSVEATIAFNKVAPYLGIGWGNPVAKDKGWGLVTDIGVMFQGKPKTDLTVTCITTCPAQLQTDAATENTKLQNDLSGFKMWPVVSLGISYQW